MKDIEKTKNEAQERTELRQKINRSLILEENEDKKILIKRTVRERIEKVYFLI